MSDRPRLTDSQIVILRSMAKRGGSVRPVSIEKWQRKPAVPLWRRGLVEIWFRQSVEHPSPRGPFYALTIVGARIAASFLNPAPRGISGAEQGP